MYKSNRYTPIVIHQILIVFIIPTFFRESEDIVVLSLTLTILLVSLFPDPRLAAAFAAATLSLLANTVWLAFGLSLGVLGSSSVLLAVQPAIEYAESRRGATSKALAVAAISAAMIFAYYLYWALRALSTSLFYDVGFFVGIFLALPWRKGEKD